MKSWLCLVGVLCPLFAGAQCFNGFWEGPHLADADKKFYVHLQLTDSLPLA